MDDTPLREQEPTPGITKFLSCVWAQCFVRLLDFFNMSMIIPTLSKYLVSAGGTTDQYYLILAISSVLQIVTSFVIGIIVDRTGKLLPLYIITIGFAVAGNALYAMADVIPELRDPVWIITARSLIGIGSSNFAFGLIYLGRAALPDERQKWSAIMAMTRTGGLLVGPGVTTLLTLAFNSQGDTGDPPTIPPAGGYKLWDEYAMPASFLTLANLIGLIWIVASWKDPPPAVAPDADGDGSTDLSTDLSTDVSTDVSTQNYKTVLQFLCQPKAMACTFVFFSANFLISSLEYMVPVVADKVLHWDSNLAGGILMCIAVGAMASQVSTIVLKNYLESRQILLMGSCGVCMMLILTLSLWLANFGTILPVSYEVASPLWFVCVAPFVFLETFVPWLAISTMAIWVTFVAEEIPQKSGLVQAIFLNFAMLGNLMAPLWDGISYGDQKITEEGMPWTAMLGIAVVVAIELLCIVAVFPQMEMLAPIDTAPGQLERKNSSFKLNEQAETHASLLERQSSNRVLSRVASQSSSSQVY